MNRILLDTSVYGRLVNDETTLQSLEREQETHHIIVYGTRAIRQEIRRTPKNITLEGRKLRILLLNIYDALVQKDNHDLAYNKLVETLSEDYFKEYGMKNPIFKTYSDFKIELSRRSFRYDA